MDWDDYPVILGFGSTHEMNETPDEQRSRLWGLKSTSKAACMAADAGKPKPRTRKVGFLAHRPR